MFRIVFPTQAERKPAMSHNVLPTKKRRNPNSQELGLRIANIFGRYLLKSDHLTTASGRTICRSPSQTCRKHRSFTRSFCEKIFPEAYRASSTSAAAPDTMPNCCSPAGIRSIASRRALISPPSPGKSSGSAANCTNAPSKSCRPAASTTVCSSARAFSTSIWIPYFYACRNF